MCDKRGVQDYLLLLNPDSQDRIQVFGNNVIEALGEDLKSKKWDKGFTVVPVDQKYEKDGKPLYVNQYAWEVPVISKFAWEKKKWNCEMIISASTTTDNQVF